MSAPPANPNTPPDHVTIEIDGVALTAPKGSMIIQAADRAGIPIPRFCYHAKLPIAANCRQCLVEVEKTPKPMPACATPVMDGMRVLTRSPKALSAQRNVMEFLLINHPLDCPICDQGGECELQDLSLGYGRSVSRYVERKRVVADEDLGPLVATEMTRCIHCTRCVRVMADIAGTYELGSMNRGEDLVIGTYDGKPLTSELSGNVIDVCPVGALTDKVFRFKARPWELIACESIGYHDALGSNLFVHTLRGEVLRAVPRDNEAVNECWLSDRDRYSHQGLYAEDRANKPLVRIGEDWREASWEEALTTAAMILKRNAGDALGVLAHPATSNEEGALLKALADGLGCGNLDHRIGQSDFTDAPLAEPFAMPVAELEQAQAVLLVGCNPRHEIPLLHQRLRKAGKRGAKIFAINPVDFEFSFELAGKRITVPSRLPAELEALMSGDAIFDALKQAGGNAAVVLGEIAETHPRASRLRSLARALCDATAAKFNRIPQGANALGLARHAVLPAKLDAHAMLAQPRSAYVVYGLEPSLDFADGALALKALGDAKVVAFSHYACASTRALADVILPIALLPEMQATLTNVDGFDQATQAGGRPPSALQPDANTARSKRGWGLSAQIAAETRPGWRVLRALGERLGLAGFDFTDLAGLRAQMHARDMRSGQGSATAPVAADGDSLERIATTAIYRSDAVLRRAPALQAHPLTRGARVALHPADALARGLSEGALAKIGDARSAATLPVTISARIARGAAWIESGYPASAPLAAHGALSVTKA